MLNSGAGLMLPRPWRGAAHQDQLRNAGGNLRRRDEGIAILVSGPSAQSVMLLGSARANRSISRGSRAPGAGSPRAGGRTRSPRPPVPWALSASISFGRAAAAAGIDRQLGPSRELDDAERVLRVTPARIAGDRDEPQDIELGRRERQRIATASSIPGSVSMMIGRGMARRGSFRENTANASKIAPRAERGLILSANQSRTTQLF